MFHSIRWRLVLSYALLTLLTVSLVGVLALSLVKRYVQQQERERLTANAEAVVRQARALMWPVVRHRELQELAQTSSFLGNARVRILDQERRVLADAWPNAGGAEFVWIVPPLEWQIQVSGDPSSPLILALPSGRQVILATPPVHSSHLFEGLPPGTAFTHVRRWDGVWGSRFSFYALQETEQSPRSSTDQQAMPRSERAITLPIGEARGPLGYVEISRGPDFASEALTTIRQALSFAAGGATLVAVVVGLLVSRGLSAPVRELTEAAGRMSGGDLAPRAPVRGRGEIGQLAAQFNHMAGRLEASFAELKAERDALRQFIADASHELRTPITALVNFNELLQGAAADDPAARTEFLAESRVQLKRLEWITRDLLDLSRLDAGLVALDVANHDAGELIAAAASSFRTLAQEVGIALTTRPPLPPLEVACDRARIELALSNLVHNALKFTPPGGQIEIGAERGTEVARLWVRDSGPGIDPEDLPHIFERFYRGRAGREEGQEGRAEGSGLGLAIVQSVVQAHGGRVSVENEPGAGSFFAIELPLQAA